MRTISLRSSFKRFFFVIISLICTGLVFDSSLRLHKQWTIKTRSVSSRLPPRLRDDQSCFATDFHKASRPFPLKYLPTRLFEKAGAGATKSSKAPPLDNKNVLRVVFGSRHSANANTQDEDLPTVYLITPTYTRFTQKADMLRMCYTLMHVPRVHWIVVEDSKEKTATVTEVLANCHGPSVTHLVKAKTNKTRHRGVDQRNAGLDWIHQCVHPSLLAGGVSFADDDNTYDLLYFEAVRWTQKVSMWPVGVVGGSLWEGPVCSEGKVIGWEGSWMHDRKFPVDMASFSVGVTFLLSRQSRFSHSTPPGRLETYFLDSLSVSVDEITPEPDANCSQVLAWHTQTTKPKKLAIPKKVIILKNKGHKRFHSNTYKVFT